MNELIHAFRLYRVWCRAFVFVFLPHFLRHTWQLIIRIFFSSFILPISLALFSAIKVILIGFFYFALFTICPLGLCIVMYWAFGSSFDPLGCGISILSCGVFAVGLGFELLARKIEMIIANHNTNNFNGDHQIRNMKR